MYAARILLDLTGPELRDWFDQSQAEGFRVQSIATYGPWADPLHAVLWHQTGGPVQGLHRDVDGSDLVSLAAEERTLLRYPALLSGTSQDKPRSGPPREAYTRYSVVTEELKPRPGQPRDREPVLLEPTSWSVFSAKVGGLHGNYYLRSADMVRPRSSPLAPDTSPNDDVAPTDEQQVQGDPWLRFAGTLWPHAEGAPWFSSGVRLGSTAPGEDWMGSWSTQLMRNQSSLMAATGSTAKGELAEPGLSVWEDRMFEPWPEGDPFAFDSSALSDFALKDRLRCDRAGAATIDQVVSDRIAGGYYPLSVGAHGTTLDSAVFHVTWAPPTSWSPLPKAFVMRGPGATRGTFRRSSGSTIRYSPALRARSRGLFASARAGHDFYEEAEVAPNHHRLRPRLPLTTSSTLRNFVPAGDANTPSGGPSNTPTEAPSQAPAVQHGFSSGPAYAPSEANEDQAAPYQHPFDTAMRKVMLRGARAAYLVVLRGGELKFLRSYTLAEEGYPITEPHHRFRLASVTKPILATLLQRQFRNIPDGLSNTLAAELEMSPYQPIYPGLRQATLEQALRHATGFVDTYVDTILGGDVIRLANAPEKSPALLALGTLRKWFANYENDDAVPYWPGQKHAYNNYVFGLLGEVYGRRSRTNGEFGDWSQAIAEAFQDAGCSPQLERILGGRSYRESRGNGEVPYHGNPAVSPSRWRIQEEPLPYVHVPYDQDVDLFGCAGCATLSSVELARFLAALTPRANHFSWGEVTDLRALASIDPAIEGGASQGLGWGVGAPTAWRSTRSGTAANVSVQRLAHNGALVGTAAWVVHQAIFGYAAIGAPPVDYTDTLSLGLAFNRDNVVEQADIDALLAIAQAVELDNGWPSGDLFDEV